MIDFIKKFLASLSDQELHYLMNEANSENYRRMQNRPKLHNPDGGFPDLSEEEKNFVIEGKVINAIKEYRWRTGHGLKESKDAVEAWMRQRQVG